ncbi:cobalt ABC transporter permease [Aestuariispira ectoiniformans]|uniref:cobalt ABC transporter permease n=1 Tax=Aestuariispira ectoiniformans TaxID=2775080 RepID=UPI00223BA8DC|nr:cobalt ABC transporter permease [Aestuariispira ectoiniformans]
MIRKTILMSVLAAGLVAATPAAAHKVIASAYAEGQKIEGEIGFSNGDMAAGALVEVFDDSDRKLGETRTDADGIFDFTPKEKVVHIFKANLGAGHVAQYRMEIADLPEDLAGGPSIVSAVQAAEVESPEQAPTTGNLKDFKRLVEDAVRREVKPLRREIAAYKEKNDMQSILGGIGYIVGIFGFGFYIAARRQAKKANT